MDELAKEASLENEYSQLQSEAEIKFGHRTLNLSLLVPYLESTDRNTRKEAHRALDVYYQGRRETYDRIFDDLVKVRTQAALKSSATTLSPNSAISAWSATTIPEKTLRLSGRIS